MTHLISFIRHSTAFMLIVLFFYSGLQMKSGSVDPIAPCGTASPGLQAANAGPCSWVGCDGGEENCIALSVNIYGIIIRAECFQPNSDIPQLPEGEDTEQLPRKTKHI